VFHLTIGLEDKSTSEDVEISIFYLKIENVKAWEVYRVIRLEMEEHDILNTPESPCLDWLKNGKKKFEGRLMTKIDEWKLFIGKEIKFYDRDNPNSYIICQITNMPCFDDFGIAFDSLGDKLIPSKTRYEVINFYNKIFHDEDEVLVDGVASQKIGRVGVVAIELNVLYSQ
jgi:hypothetical protein